MRKIIYACDTGSTRKQRSGQPAFAWVRLEMEGSACPTGSQDIDALADALRSDLKNECAVAIGFEAPLFLPVPKNSQQLSAGRPEEGNRAWSAPSGGYVATLAVHQCAWLLRELRCPDSRWTATLDYRGWMDGTVAAQLLVWEAFVSGAAHSPTHVRDAATAGVFFKEHQRNLPDVDAIQCDSVFSLIGAVLMWSGWCNDPNGLHQAALVLKPHNCYSGEIKVL